MYDAISIPVQFNLIRIMHGNSYNVYCVHLTLRTEIKAIGYFVFIVSNQFSSSRKLMLIILNCIGKAIVYNPLMNNNNKRKNIKQNRTRVQISDEKKIENSVARFTKPDKFSNHILWISRILWNFGKAIQHPFRHFAGIIRECQLFSLAFRNRASQ